MSERQAGTSLGYLARLVARTPLPDTRLPQSDISPPPRFAGVEPVELPGDQPVSMVGQLPVASEPPVEKRRTQSIRPTPTPAPEATPQPTPSLPPRPEKPIRTQAGEPQSRPEQPPHIGMAAHLEIDSNLQPKEAPTRHAAAKAPEGLELADSIMRQFLPASRLERGRSVRESVPIRDEPPSGADRRAPDDSPQEQPVVVAPVKRAEVEPTDQPVVRPSSIRPPHWQVPPEEWSPAGKGQTILSSTLEIGRISVEILPQPAAAQPSRAQTRPAARAVRMCSGPPPSIHRFRGGL